MFQLDTSGTVAAVTSNPKIRVDAEWSDLDDFTRGYIAALFAAHSVSRYRSDEERTYSHGAFDMLAPETLARIMKDCREFQAADAWKGCDRHLNALAFGDFSGKIYPSNVSGGRDFWLTRNGHGAGFWDGSWPEPYASELDQLAKAAGPAEVYLGDDGRIYLT